MSGYHRGDSSKRRPEQSYDQGSNKYPRNDRDDRYGQSSSTGGQGGYGSSSGQQGSSNRDYQSSGGYGSSSSGQQQGASRDYQSSGGYGSSGGQQQGSSRDYQSSSSSRGSGGYGGSSGGSSSGYGDRSSSYDQPRSSSSSYDQYGSRSGSSSGGYGGSSSGGDYRGQSSSTSGVYRDDYSVSRGGSSSGGDYGSSSRSGGDYNRSSSSGQQDYNRGNSSTSGYGASSSSYDRASAASSGGYGGSSGSSSYDRAPTASSGGYGGSSGGRPSGSSFGSAPSGGSSFGGSSGGSSFGGSSGGGGGGGGACRDFANNGSCRFGATCKFSHDGASSGGGGGGGGFGGRARSGGGGGSCNSFKNTGSCRFGDSCKFSHDGASGGGSSGGGGSSFGGGGSSFGGGSFGGDRGYNAPSSPSGSTTSEVSLPSLDLGVADQSLNDVRRSRDAEREANALVPALTALDLTAKKSPGSRGQPTTCVANMFEFKWKPQTVHQSLVVFPDYLPSDDPAARRVYFNKFKDQVDAHFSVASFDTSTIVSLEKKDEHTFSVADPDNPSTFLTLTIRPLKSLDSSDTDSQEVQACINKLVKGLIRKLEVIQFNRAYYFPEPHQLEGSISVYRGFQMVVSPLSSGFQLNVDLAHRVVHKRNVREQMNDIERRTKERMPSASATDLWKAIIENCHSELRGSVVVTTYSKRCYRIDAIDYGKSPDSELITKEGKTTFRDYMKTRYGIDLPPGERRGMVVHFPRRGRQGTAEPLYFVPELLSVTGVSEKMKSDGRLMKKLADMTRLPAAVRMGRINEMIDKLLGIQAVKDEMIKSSVIINNQPTPIETRILGPFNIQTRSKGTIQISAAKTSFQSEAKSFGFFAGASQRIQEIRQWVFMVDPEFTNMVDRTTIEIVNVARRQGVTLPRPTVVSVEHDRRGRTNAKDWQTCLENLLTRGRPDFIVFLNPGGDEAIYAQMKGSCIEAHGIVTQCLSTDTLKNDKRFSAVIANTVVQLMAKLGATPWRASISDFLPESLVGPGGCMIVGVDVEHEKAVGSAYENPSLGQSNNRSRSCVAFTATYDHPHHNSFNSFVAFQGPQTEICESAQEMMRRCLIAYADKNNGKMPTSVYVYRDGVGDSQLKVFVHKEIKSFEAAFAALGISPKLTVLVVQKKLSIRLFEVCPRFAQTGNQCPQPRCSGQEQYHSPIPGTVADKTITSKLLSEFFLVPTAAPNGATSRPTRFIIVRDDLNQSMDDMQSLTHCMTYLYFNWNGPIRVPAPVMYAHKLAFLFGKYINVTNIHQELSDKLFFL